MKLIRMGQALACCAIFCACGSAGEGPELSPRTDTASSAASTRYYVPGTSEEGPVAHNGAQELPPIEVTSTPPGPAGMPTVLKGPAPRGGPVVVHGPVVLSRAELGAMLNSPAAASADGMSTRSLHLWQSWRLNHPNGTGLAEGTGCNCDPQFAASPTNAVGICSENIAFYSRSGTPLGEPSATGKKPIEAFFTPLSGVLPYGNYFDNRLIFDDYRQRFWVTSLVTPTGSSPPGSTPKVFMAISQSADATGGWYYYWTDGNAPSCTACGIDFQTTGIARDRFLVSNGASDAAHGSYAHVMHFDAVAAANGGAVTGWQWWNLTNPDGSNVDLWTAPVRSHNTTAAAAYFVGHYSTNKLLIWTLPDGSANPGYMYYTQYTLANNYNNYGDSGHPPPMYDGSYVLRTDVGPQGGSYAYRNGTMVAAWHERYSAAIDEPGIRVVGLNIGTGSRIFDVRLGIALSSGWSFGYPAVDISASGTIGLAFSETNLFLYPSIMFTRISPTGVVTSPYLNSYGGTGWDTYNAPNGCLFAGTNGIAWSDVSTMQADPGNSGYSSFWASNQFGSNSGRQYQIAVVNAAADY